LSLMASDRSTVPVFPLMSFTTSRQGGAIQQSID
jgi:hypothetical protein